jgi:radical SAM superfamily enzyme YgiQ (UPF0313 family)
VRKIKKIILIRPPLNLMDKGAITDVTVFFPPQGIFLLSSILKSEGYEVIVKDMYEDSWPEVEDYFKNNSGDVIGINCLTGQHLNCFKVARIAKKQIKPEPIIILGGPHPSANRIDNQILSNYPEVGFIVRGEGERAIIELLKGIINDEDLRCVNGITFREGDKIVRTPDREVISDLDSLPFADYSDFDFKKTENISDGRTDIRCGRAPIRFAPFISSRGCPNRCQFCAIFMGRKVRLRSPENVVSELENLYRTRGVSHFTFGDDCFNASLSRAEKICELILERRLPVTWTAMARVTPLSDNFLKLAKSAGCLMLAFGVESGSPNILKTIKKNIDLDDFSKAIEMTKKAGITSAALFMVGNPGETKETIDESIELIKRSRPDTIVVSPTLIFPNSELYDLALEKGIIDDRYWLENDTLPYYTEKYSIDDLRYFRLKIIFYHSLFKRDISMLIKTGILILGYKFIKLFNLDVNRTRDALFRVPILRLILKGLKTA